MEPKLEAPWRAAVWPDRGGIARIAGGHPARVETRAAGGRADRDQAPELDAEPDRPRWCEELEDRFPDPLEPAA